MDEIRNLIVIPARGGSTGVPNKALRAVGGKPLLWHTLDYICNETSNGDEVIVVTDSDKIREAVTTYGGALCMMEKPREPENLIAAVRDTVVKHGEGYSYVTILNACSPIHAPGTLRNAIARLIRQGIAKDGVTILSPCRENHERIMTTERAWSTTSRYIGRFAERQKQTQYVKHTGFSVWWKRAFVDLATQYPAVAPFWIAANYVGYVEDCLTFDVNDIWDFLFLDAYLRHRALDESEEKSNNQKDGESTED